MYHATSYKLVSQFGPAVKRAMDAFNNPADRTGYFELYDQDVILHGFPPGLPPGIAGLKAFYGSLWKAFPDCSLELSNVVTQGDRVATMYKFKATHRDEFMGVQATGRRVEIMGMTILRFVGDKCVERWNIADMLSLMQQLTTK
jgi:predicted ester cyclase